jgi:flagellar motility protein MotE (MotC chaperone)
MKNYWNDTRKAEVAQNLEKIASLQRQYKLESVEERRCTSNINEQQSRHSAKVSNLIEHYSLPSF